MALSSKTYEQIHPETGNNLAKLKGKFDDGYHLIATEHPEEFPELAAVIYQIQKMQDEIDYLRGVIEVNDRKVSMTLGTSSSTALAGNTTTISTAQSNAIIANTAKTSMTLGTSGSTALAGDTTTISTAQAKEITASTALGAKLNVAAAASKTKSTAITFGEFTATPSKSGTTYSLPIKVVETDTSGKSPVTTTKTGSITLT